jgi:serpin B
VVSSRPIEPMDQTMVVAGNTAFATALYGEAARSAGNVFVAPASISTALAMTYAGARGETATEMARALHLPTLAPPRIHAAFGALAAAGDGAPGVELATAGALFGQRGYGFLPGFLALLAERYGAGLRQVDFEAATEEARREINDWVAQQTKSRIEGLVPEGVLTALTRLVLVNAIYFKGTWAAQFEKRRTRDEPFYLLGGGSTRAPLMAQKGDFKLVDAEGAQVLELPYAGGSLAMVVILPREKDGLSALETKLESGLGGWLEQLDQTPPDDVQVFLPRFRIELALRLDEALKHLGMTLAFEQDRADFAGMTGRPDLCIGAVLHKAFVDVNEEGTTAAAATAVVMMSRSLPAPPPVFRADHPFVFLIRDKRTKSVLFLGRLLDPAR